MIEVKGKTKEGLDFLIQEQEHNGRDESLAVFITNESKLRLNGDFEVVFNSICTGIYFGALSSAQAFVEYESESYFEKNPAPPPSWSR